MSRHDFGRVFFLLRKWAGISYNRLGEACDIKSSRVCELARGEGAISTVAKVEAIADALGIPGRMVRLAPRPWESDAPPLYEDDFDAAELARRAEASDVGTEFLDHLDGRFDDLAVRYQTAPPAQLLSEVRRHCAYVQDLMEKRATLAQQRCLLASGAWFSLLGATLHIDLRQPGAATARLRTARVLAQHAEHAEIHAWTYETEAWRVLTAGDYPRAVELARAAQEMAPRGGSAEIQATAQEGRARARLGERREAYRAIDRVRGLAAAMQLRARPEHHYQYDPAKASAYEATTLAWAGDPAAEAPAREVIARLTPGGSAAVWPRRAVSAHLDLALTLLSCNRLDEACDAAQKALLSGRLLPANHWRALEVVREVESRHLPEASELREAYEDMTGPA
ncbi:helix-turn-helix domain-containing protein [Streptomyces sp. ODS28]|uniref:helix-turn-helix domain-containing protein n=1 Tax=Streptomyces sp. ODS28 TaxID=3136688 RepID=UPI0031EB5899